MNHMITLESIEFSFLPLLYHYTFIYTSSIQTKILIDKFKKKNYTKFEISAFYLIFLNC